MENTKGLLIIDFEYQNCFRLVFGNEEEKNGAKKICNFLREKNLICEEVEIIDEENIIEEGE